MEKHLRYKDEPDFINKFEESIIAEFSLHPYGCDFMDRESWSEWMKQGRNF